MNKIQHTRLKNKNGTSEITFQKQSATQHYYLLNTIEDFQ